ncbi:hypothetical protein P9847_22585 [Paenibacillus chibensis]|uniref:Uncharacterized protein n=1 Tax=Paenibacillus chibensis TaxID=59846 RepID=A0ABU6Q129_9BACL|nr:hypothetical protein [Paenibacillus chibensis]
MSLGPECQPGKIAVSFQEALAIITEQGVDKEKTHLREQIHWFEQAHQAEQEGIDHLKRFMRERIGNRFDHIGQR